jgi:hypothetical protein
MAATGSLIRHKADMCCLPGVRHRQVLVRNPHDSLSRGVVCLVHPGHPGTMTGQCCCNLSSDGFISVLQRTAAVAEAWCRQQPSIGSMGSPVWSSNSWDAHLLLANGCRLAPCACSCWAACSVVVLSRAALSGVTSLEPAAGFEAPSCSRLILQCAHGVGRCQGWRTPVAGQQDS